MTKRIQTENDLLRKLLCVVVPEDVFCVDKQGKAYLGGYPITEKEVKSLREEIAYLEKTRIWGVLTNTIANDAKQRMFECAKDFDDMRGGKFILYAIDLQKKIMNLIKK